MIRDFTPLHTEEKEKKRQFRQPVDRTYQCSGKNEGFILQLKFVYGLKLAGIDMNTKDAGSKAVNDAEAIHNSCRSG